MATASSRVIRIISTTTPQTLAQQNGLDALLATHQPLFTIHCLLLPKSISFPVSLSLRILRSSSAYRTLAFSVGPSASLATAQPTVTVPPLFVPNSSSVSHSRKKKSKIWIVGVVIGILAVLAIVGIIAFILISRKKKKARAAAGQGDAYNNGAPPPGNFQQPMQQQYVPPLGVGQQQYGPPPQEGSYYANDPKNPQLYPQNGPPQSPPPPIWTPNQHQSPTQPPPPSVSPQTPHTSLAASDVLAMDQQRDAQNKSPGTTVSEMGSSMNNLGANPSLSPQSPTGTHMTGISENTAAPTQPPLARVPMEARNNQGPVSELQ